MLLDLHEVVTRKVVTAPSCLLFLIMISLIFRLGNFAVSALGMGAEFMFLGNAGHSVSLSGNIREYALSKFYLSRIVHYVL